MPPQEMISLEKVKGTIFIDFVKTLRRLKDERLYQYLTNEDREIVSGVIFASGWYPLATYHRVLVAFWEVIAEKNPAAAREWGRMFGTRVFESIYKDTITIGNVSDGVKSFIFISKTFFTHAHLEEVSLSAHHAQLRVVRKVESPVADEVFFYILCGALERFVEMSGGSNPRVTFGQKVLEIQRHVIFDLHWD